jgi:hypothetical protein
MRRFVLGCTLTLLAAIPLHAQSFTTAPCNGDEGNTHNNSFFGGKEKVCELRRATLPLVNNQVTVSGKNGGIEVIGEDRQDIALEARVSAHAGSQSEAASILHEVTIETGSTVEAHGPHPIFGNRNWSASYKLHVPHHLAANFHTLNGGLSLTALNGAIHGETTNGGLHLENLGGDVHVSTTNGGISASLDGNTWQGTGLSAKAVNGGVSVSVSHSYSAHLVASTVNGGISLNVPGANQSEVHRHSVDTNLGSGGPTISFETVNGGVSIH